MQTKKKLTPKKTTNGKKVATAKPKGKKSSAAGEQAEPQQVGNSLKGLFKKDLEDFMLGFGETTRPLGETVDALEAISIEFISSVFAQVLEVAGPRTKLTQADLHFVLRKAPHQVARAAEMVYSKIKFDAMRTYNTDPGKFSQEDIDELFADPGAQLDDNGASASAGFSAEPDTMSGMAWAAPALGAYGDASAAPAPDAPQLAMYS